MALGDRIKECRQAAHLSQEKVAELLGVSRQAVTKWEANQSAPNKKFRIWLSAFVLSIPAVLIFIRMNMY